MPVELELLALFGQLSVLPDLFVFELEPPPLLAFELADGDADCANACVTPTPQIANPLASAAATAALRIVLVIPITPFALGDQHIERN